MTPEAAIRSLGAVAAAVAAYWFGLAGAIEPPDEQAREFFVLLSAAGGLVLGAAVLVARDKKLVDWRAFAAAGLLSAAFGILGFVQYERERTDRVAIVRDVGSEREVIVTDVLSSYSFSILTGPEGPCSSAEIVDAEQRRVTFECAKRAADDRSGELDTMFDGRSLTRSVETLITWYRVMALGFMLAIFFGVDYVLHRRAPRRAPQNQ